MPKYMLVHKTDNDWTQLPKSQINQIMQAWGEWLGTMNTAVIDKGEPFNPSGKTVTAQGTVNADTKLSG
jgi:hypothetical protein